MPDTVAVSCSMDTSQPSPDRKWAMSSSAARVPAADPLAAAWYLPITATWRKRVFIAANYIIKISAKTRHHARSPCQVVVEDAGRAVHRRRTARGLAHLVACFGPGTVAGDHPQ